MVVLGENTVSVNGVSFDVSRLVYVAIAFFVGKRGELVTRDELCLAVWGEDETYETGIDDARIDKMIARVRAVVGKESLVTRRGFGYVFDDKQEYEQTQENSLSLMETELIAVFRDLSRSDKYKAMRLLKALGEDEQ